MRFCGFHFYFYICGRKSLEISVVSGNSHCKKLLPQENDVFKIKAFIAFSINKRNALVKGSTDICEEQENPIEERCVYQQREDVCLDAAEKISLKLHV